MAALVLLFLAAIGLAAPASAEVADHVVARAFLEDPTGALGLEDVRGRDFAPFDGVLTRGFGTSAIWLRLRIDPTAADGGAANEAGDAAENLILRIQPAFLDEIALYDPEAGTSEPRLAGDRHERAAGEYTSANINFTVPRGAAPRDLYLRIETSSTRLVSVMAMPPLETLARDQRQQIVNAFYPTFPK